MVGAGTVVQPHDLVNAADAGAVIAVSPGLRPALSAAAASGPIPLLPGEVTPSEVIAACRRVSELKLFPAQQTGGIGMLRAMSGPLADVSFCPTGGIDAESAADFLALPNVACVGGSWLVPRSAVAAGDCGAIRILARNAATLRNNEIDAARRL